jgi:allantoinase
MKQAANFFKVWGGISGAQHLMPLLITLGHFDRQADLSLLLRFCSANVARRFKLPAGKGRIAAGSDADLALVNLDENFDVRAADVHYRHRQSPYVGRRLRGSVRRTLVRGQTVCQDGQIVAKPQGWLVSPT